MKLNIGCGRKLLNGYVNIDAYPINEDVISGDLMGTLPFPDGSADEILLDNVIEHIDSVVTGMGEVSRLLKPGGIVKIITPHYSSHSSWRDPTHKHHLSYFSFEYFTSEKNYIPHTTFRLVEKHLSFGGGWPLIGRLIFLINPKLYEKYFAFIFPASTITVTLKKYAPNQKDVF